MTSGFTLKFSQKRIPNSAEYSKKDAYDLLFLRALLEKYMSQPSYDDQ